MLWYLVWTVLVVGTLVGAFLLLRDLYRSAKRLGAELVRAQDVLAQVLERADELAAAAESSGSLTPVELVDREPARARLAAAAPAAERRRDARAARHQRAFERWRSFSR